MTSGSSLPVGVEGLRRCFVRYEDEPADLGKDGRTLGMGNENSGWVSYSMYEGVRLAVGVDCLEVAGESCDGGV